MFANIFMFGCLMFAANIRNIKKLPLRSIKTEKYWNNSTTWTRTAQIFQLSVSHGRPAWFKLFNSFNIFQFFYCATLVIFNVPNICEHWTYEHKKIANIRTTNIEQYSSNIEHRTLNIRELCNYRTLNIRTLNNEHRTSNDEHRTLIFEYWTMNIEHRTLNNNHRTLNNEHRTLNISFEHWTSNIEHLFFWKLANMANIECSMFDVRWPLTKGTL